MTVLSINPIFQKKCEYADLEYLSEAIYEHLARFVADNINNLDMEDLVEGEFDVLINWRNNNEHT